MKGFFYLIGFFFLIRVFAVMLPFALYIGVFFFLMSLATRSAIVHRNYYQVETRKPSEEKKETVREKVTIPPNNTVEGVLFWTKRIQLTERIRRQPDLYNSLVRSQSYLEKLLEHDYNSNEKIIENITESLMNYDMLLHKEILSDSVEQTLIQIENSFYNYEKAFEAMYNSTIDSELMDIDSHTDVLNQQLKLNGLLPSDFEENIYSEYNDDNYLNL